MAEGQDKIWKMLDDVDICMLVDRFQAGLRARPMWFMVEDDRSCIWMVVNLDTGTVDEVQANPEVCVSIQDGNDYVSITGRAQAMRDVAKQKELWSPWADAWFEGGHDDPKAGLLKITPVAGEYWDNPSKTMSSIRMLIASATDTTPDMGENEKVQFG